MGVKMQCDGEAGGVGGGQKKKKEVTDYWCLGASNI